MTNYPKRNFHCILSDFQFIHPIWISEKSKMDYGNDSYNTAMKLYKKEIENLYDTLKISNERLNILLEALKINL